MNIGYTIKSMIKSLGVLKTKLAMGIVFIAIGVFVFAVIVNIVFNPSAPQKRSSSTVTSEYKAELIDSLSEIDSLSPGEQEEIRAEQAFYCSVTGQLCHDDPTKITHADVENSYVKKASRLFLYPFTNMPASGISTATSAFVNAGVLPQIHAYEGYGFQLLSPFQAIWIQIRNATYAIIVLLLLVEAFALMFRAKADSNSAINIESFIPKIVLVLIMIHLSFAISGFLIDLMYIVIVIVYLVFRPLMVDIIDYPTFMSTYLFGNPGDLFTFIRTALTGHPDSYLGLFGSYWDIYMTIPNQLIFMFGDAVGNLLSGIISVVFLDKIIPFLGAGKITAIFKGLKGLGKAGGILAVLVGGGLTLDLVPRLVLGMILFLGLIYVVVKVFLVLLRAYIMILILTIFAPFYILMSLVPGNGVGIQSWLKSFLGELIVYPVVFTMLFTLAALASVTLTASGGGIDLSLPFMPIVNVGFIFLVGISAISLLPKIIDGVRQMITKSVFKDFEESLVGSYRDVRNMGTRAGGAIGTGAKQVTTGRKIFKNPSKKLANKLIGGI